MNKFTLAVLMFGLGFWTGVATEATHAQSSFKRDTAWCETYENPEVRDLCLRFDAHTDRFAAHLAHVYQGENIREGEIRGKRQ